MGTPKLTWGLFSFLLVKHFFIRLAQAPTTLCKPLIPHPHQINSSQQQSTFIAQEEINITAALRSNSMTKVICIWPGSSHYQLPLLSLAWNWIGCGRQQLKRDRESFTATKQDLKLLLLPWKVPYYTDDVADFGNSLSYLNFPVLSATTRKGHIFTSLDKLGLLCSWLSMSIATDHAVSVNWLDYCNSQPDQKPALAAYVELWDWTGSLTVTKTGAQN